MAPRKPPRRTRERILEVSLALFNREGEPHITTADIADEMNISPGNLYYHFRNKDDIIGELWAQYEKGVAPMFTVPDDPPPGVEDLWFFLHVLFERMRDYRFFYRDLDEITSRDRKLALRVADLLRRFEGTVLELCRSLVRTGRMRASEREIGALSANATLVSTYWMSWQRVGGAHRGGGGDINLDLAAYHVLALFAPFLVGDGRALIEKLGQDYL
ncbi:MAG: TetR family transcriptional regulator [Burkholderiales bacterium]|nr:TetR family transcriptional regulator [Burkholderiales bacterium]